MTALPKQALGRAKTAVIFVAGEHVIAAVCTILARVKPQNSDRRVTTAGAIAFDAGLVNHVELQILPVLDHIGEALLPDFEPFALELSAVNLAAASVHDVGARIGGFSADAAIFLSSLSALLAISVRQDVLVSGHLASDRGDIGAVRGLPEKLAAATSDPSVRRFVIPSLSNDASWGGMLPADHERTAEAVIRARRDFRVVEAANVAELIRESMESASIVMGSLQIGFFEAPSPSGDESAAVDGAIRYLMEDLDARFWKAIEEHVFAAGVGQLRCFLDARVNYEIKRTHYPPGFGHRLRRLLLSLPPSLLRKRHLFPLMRTAQVLDLCRFAKPNDCEDVQELLQVATGKLSARERGDSARGDAPSRAHDEGVAAVLAELSAESLAAKISLPIDTARSVFLLDSVVAESNRDFWDTVNSFYVTLLRHSGSPQACADDPQVIHECRDLLASAFVGEDGKKVALQEARFPTSRGGLRFVLDAMADQFKRKLTYEYVLGVVAEAFEAKDWDATKRFAAALLEHLRPNLPPDLVLDSPAQLVPRCADILMAYVRSRDRMTQLIRSL
jgi:hypothetical protein